MRATSILFAIALALCASGSRAETILVQSGEDSSPYSFTPDNTRGLASTAYAFRVIDGGHLHSFAYYIRFDLPPELLAPGVAIDSASARVYYGIDFGNEPFVVGQVLCRQVLAPWSESTLTWNNRPPVGPVIDGWDDVTLEGPYPCDITELVQGWVSGEIPNYGIAITSGAPRVIGFYTWNDSSVGLDLEPTLLVETLPEPRAGLWAGAVLLFALARRRALQIN